MLDGTLSSRSRDNLPNPEQDKDNAYVPLNMPAIGDLFDLFNFGKHDDQGRQQDGNSQGNGNGGTSGQGKNQGGMTI